MADTVSSEKRSWIMSRIKSKDTKPELAVRSLLFSLGLRFRLHKDELPGHPDVVLSKLNAVIFVHGCFWHRHKNCRDNSNPATNSEFWQAKFKRNMDRDARNKKELRKLGWRVLTVWECELKDMPKLERRLRRLLLKDTVEEKAVLKKTLLAAEAPEPYTVKGKLKRK